MTLKEQLSADLKQSMKDKDVIRKNTVQLTRAAILQYEKDNKTELDEAGVLDIIAKELKKRRDSLPDFERGGRMDLVEGIKSEMEVLLAYLPAQLSDSEIAAIVADAVAQTGAASIKDMGKVMAIVTAATKGRADAKVVGELVKKTLA